MLRAEWKIGKIEEWNDEAVWKVEGFRVKVNSAKLEYEGRSDRL